MTTYDYFLEMLKTKCKAKRLDVACTVGLGPRQFDRHIKGEAKERFLPVRTLALLKREGVIGEDEVGVYWQGLREELNFKNETTCSAKQIVRRFVNLIK